MDNLYKYLRASSGGSSAPVLRVIANRPINTLTISTDPTEPNKYQVPQFFIGTTGTLGASGFIDPATKTEFYGAYNPNTGVITIEGFLPGSTDLGSFENQVIIVRPNTHSANEIAQFILNATGHGTPEDWTTTGVVATGTINADSFLYTPGAGSNGVLLDGVTNPTFRHTFTSGEFTAVPELVFPHGLSFTPKVQARWASISGGGFHKMPYTAISNISYWGVPPSLSIVVNRVTSTNIYVTVGVHDGIGLSTLSSNYQMLFQFFCTRFLDGAN
jgi:hypothetical protein